jgi:sodium/hydrogen exchanger 8
MSVISDYKDVGVGANQTILQHEDEEAEMMYGWQTNAFTDNHHVIISENYLIFVLLLVSCLLLQHFVNGWKYQILPSSAATILLSMLVGFGIRLLDTSIAGPTPIFLNFSTEVFYFGLLPPIIFNSGYHLRRIIFYKNIDAILSLAFVGTFGSIIVLAIGIYYTTNNFDMFINNGLQFNMMESIAFGALLSSTDPVATLSIYQRSGIETNLYYLVFGESVLNDAVAITVYKLASNFIIRTPSDPLIPLFMILNFIVIFIGSSFIGYLCGLLLALIFKLLHFPGDKVSPIALTLCSAYLPFFLAEALQLSGIVAIFFAGISTRRYVMKNTKESIKIISASVFECLSYLAETTCFIIMGLAMVLQDFHFTRIEVMVFIAIAFALCIFARFMNIYGLLGLVSQQNRIVSPVIILSMHHYLLSSDILHL